MISFLFSAAVESEKHPFIAALFIAEIVVNIIFTFEALLKMLAFGVICGKSAYLRDAWNFADFTLVFISWGSILLVAYPALATLKTLRMLRVLRVLRTINKFPGLKLVVNALLASIRPVANVIPVMLLFYFIFGVVATSSLKVRLCLCYVIYVSFYRMTEYFTNLMILLHSYNFYFCRAHSPHAEALCLTPLRPRKRRSSSPPSRFMISTRRRDRG